MTYLIPQIGQVQLESSSVPKLSDMFAKQEDLKSARMKNAAGQRLLAKDTADETLKTQLAPKVASGDFQGALDMAGQAGNMEQVNAMRGEIAGQNSSAQESAKNNFKIYKDVTEFLAPTMAAIAQEQDPGHRAALVQSSIAQVASFMDPILPGWSEKVLGDLGDGDPAKLQAASQAGLKLVDQLNYKLGMEKVGVDKQQLGLDQQKTQLSAAQAQQDALFKQQQLAQGDKELGFKYDQLGFQMGDAAQKNQIAGSQAKTGNFTETSKLLGQFIGLPEVKNMKEALPIMASIRKTSHVSTVAADMDLIYGVAKIFDPIGSVREGDYANIKGAGAVGEQLQGLYNYLKSGHGKLTQEVKDQLMQVAESRFLGHKENYDAAAKSFIGIAQRNGINPKDVVPDLMDLSKISMDYVSNQAQGAPSNVGRELGMSGLTPPGGRQPYVPQPVIPAKAPSGAQIKIMPDGRQVYSVDGGKTVYLVK